MKKDKSWGVTIGLNIDFYLTYLRYLFGSGIESPELAETKITTTIHNSDWPIEELKKSDTLQIIHFIVPLGCIIQPKDF
jgi:hypothetical protein